jgi:hypothetical protein
MFRRTVLNPRRRRRLRNAGVAVAVTAGVALALAGAVVLLALLAVGAVVHIVVSALRAPKAATAGDPRVIDGEYVVVSGPQQAPRLPDARTG